MKQVATGMAAIGITVLSAVIFILMSVIVFFLNVWIIKVGAGFAGYDNLDGNWVVLSAGLLSAASILSAAIRR